MEVAVGKYAKEAVTISVARLVQDYYFPIDAITITIVGFENIGDLGLRV